MQYNDPPWKAKRETAVMMNNFSGNVFGNKAIGFDRPTQLPDDDAQRQQWQSANKTWWETTPMRYDWRDQIAALPGSEPYFTEVDQRFLSSVCKYMPWRNVPFDAIIPFERLADKDVLEIGVGQGTHAQLLASRCKSFTGIDLTSHAVEMTARRLRLFNISGQVLQMDAEEMAFPDESFDFIWSWGVIHHSANTRRVLEEMHRVLRFRSSCTIMVYYRSWWQFYVCGFLRAIFQREFNRLGSLHRVTQSATDGAIARYYSQQEWYDTTKGLFEVNDIKIYGQKSDAVPLPHGRPKQLVEDLLPNGVARLLTNRLRGGSFLVAQMRKA